MKELILLWMLIDGVPYQFNANDILIPRQPSFTLSFYASYDDCISEIDNRRKLRKLTSISATCIQFAVGESK